MEINTLMEGSKKALPQHSNKQLWKTYRQNAILQGFGSNVFYLFTCISFHTLHISS